MAKERAKYPDHEKERKARELLELDSKGRFIDALAAWLVGEQVKMSIRLEMGDRDAQLWAKVRGATPLAGYPTHAEAVTLLRKWLLDRE